MGLSTATFELDQIAQNAMRSADRTFFHVRRTIIELLGLPADIADELMTIKPKDVQSNERSPVDCSSDQRATQLPRESATHVWSGAQTSTR